MKFTSEFELQTAFGLSWWWISRKAIFEISSGKYKAKVAPFKFKFSRMSKSNSSTRSNSMETPAECESELNSPQSNVPAIMEAAEGQENVPSSPPPSYEFVLEEVSFFSIDSFFFVGAVFF